MFAFEVTIAVSIASKAESLRWIKSRKLLLRNAWKNTACSSTGHKKDLLAFVI